MDNSPVGLLTDQFAKLTDPRTGHAKRHKLIDVIVIAICAVICGADSWVDVEMFGKAKKDWFSRLLELPNGIPSHDTFGRIFARLDPVQFEECFEEWVEAVNEVTGGQVVAIDGKTLRRSHDRAADKSAIHMVSAWASANRLILGQTKVDERSNEITAIPELLSTLDVSGCTVTIDAMGCQKGIATTIIAGNGHLGGDNSNFSELINYYGVTAVCAVNDHDVRSDFSEMGANLWVCAPSNDSSDEHRDILTTENSDRYYEEFGGTSAATPIVAGVAALLRGVNSDLTWRDLKLILAGSARKNDIENSGWEDGASKYGMAPDTEFYHFNHEYGFGVVDAAAAVDLAKEWSIVPQLQSSTVESDELNLEIPDPPDSGDPTAVTTALTLETTVDFIEFVEVNLDFQQGDLRDWDVELVSPSGAVSTLVPHLAHISHINPAGLAAISNGTTRCSRIAEYSGYHEC